MSTALPYRGRTNSLPARPVSLPTIEVYTPEMADARRYSEQSQVFWEKAQDMLKEIEQLRKETQRIVCPCRKPECPFRHSKASRGRGSTSSASSSSSSDLVERYLASYSPPLSTRPAHYHYNRPVARTPSLTLSLGSSDFEVIEEEEEESTASQNASRFRRGSPARTARRNLTASRSLPVGTTWLCPPSPPVQTPSVRSLSLPQPTFDLRFGSFDSLNQIDSESHLGLSSSHSRIMASA